MATFSMQKQKMVTRLQNPFLFYLFKVAKLPSLAFWGIKIKEIEAGKAVVFMKHKWTNQNPFGSMYFSALAGAAELSTGLLVLVHTSSAPHSMLVTDSTSQFTKKAKGRVFFTCNISQEDVQKMDTLQAGQAMSLSLTSIAINDAGETVGNFTFNWAIKRKHAIS